MSNKFLGETLDVKQALIIVSGGGSSANSQPFSLAGVGKISVLCGLQNTTAVANATVAAPCTISVVVGTNSEVSAMTVLTGATLVMGQATLGQLTNWDVVRVAAGSGGVATGRSLVIDGTTFTFQTNGTFADKQLVSSACSLFTDSLVSAIATYCTHLETYGQVTANDATVESEIFIRRKDYGPGNAQSIDVSVSANASSTGQVYISGIRQTGIIEFTAADVLATNSSYTHFGIRFNTGVTTQDFAAIVVREMIGNNATNSGARVQL